MKNMYNIRICLCLFMLLLTASGLMAQSEFRAKVSWDPPSDDQGQPAPVFDQYRVYVCNKPIEKIDEDVQCPDGKLLRTDVDKDQHEVELVYTLSITDDMLYFRATTVRGQIESDLSEQEEIKLHRLVSLANSFYMTGASDNIDQNNAVEHLWDRCMEKTPECTTGSRQSESIWIEFDFRNPHVLQYAQLYGDTEGAWQSQSWSIFHKLEQNEQWQPAFTDLDAQVNGWIKQDLTNLRTRYVRIEIFGTPGTNTVQARELEIIGIQH
jgi:hypothetical protein